jgi:hypothetical protein
MTAAAKYPAGLPEAVAMTPDVAVSLATFVVVLWLLNRLGSTKPTGLELDPDVERARQFIRTKVDGHVDTLAQCYLEACEENRRGDEVPGSFAREIEWFIGNVLLRDVALEKPEIAPAVREVVVLEREHIYELILARVQAT